MPSNPPALGWYVEVDHPGGRTLRPTILDDIQWLPTLNDLPRVRVPVRRDETWLDPKWEDGQPMRVWKDGYQLPIEETDKVEMHPERAVLVGIGGVELETRVRKSIQAAEAHAEAETLVTNNTSYATNVDDPAPATTTDVPLQETDSTAEWQTALSRELDDLPETEPWYIENGKLKAHQTGFFVEAEDGSLVNGSTVTDSAFSGGEAVTVDDLAQDLEVTINVPYDIPAGNFDVRYRARSQTGEPEYRVYLDSEILEESLAGGTFSLGWKNAGTSTGSVLEGEHTIAFRVEGVDQSGGGTPGDLDVDAVWAGDNRFSYTFDNSVDANGALAGPELYPDAVTVVGDDVVSAGQIEAGGLDVTMDATDGSQAIAISNDRGDTWHTAANSATVSATFASKSAFIRPRFTLSRTDSGSTTTPTSGDVGHEIDLATLSVDVDPTPLLVNKSFDGSLVEVLQEIADDSGQIWEVTRNASGDIQVEWTTPGQRTDDRAETVLDYDVRKTNLRPYDEVLVRGAPRPRTNETFTTDVGTFVALDTEHIERFSEVVYDLATSTIFENDDDVGSGDYVMNYSTGEIKALAGGGMSDSTLYHIDYRWEPRGSHPRKGLPALPRTRVVQTPTATGERECGELARTIYERIETPIYEVEIVLSTLDPRVSLVDDIRWEGVPTDGTRTVTRSIEHEPGSVRIRSRSRKSVGEVIEEIRGRLSTVEKRV